MPELPSRVRTKFNEIVDSGAFEGLIKASNKEEAFKNMDSWEAANQDQCEVLEVEFDLIDHLLEAVNFLSVDAFEDPADHVEAQGKGAVAQLQAKVIDHRSVQDKLNAIAEEAMARSEEIAAGDLGRIQRLRKVDARPVEPFRSWLQPEGEMGSRNDSGSQAKTRAQHRDSRWVNIVTSTGSPIR